MGQLSPMMQHYVDTKKDYNDCILFYRLGDFYEMFFDDAKTASRELEITLTGKKCGLEELAPMCGVPHHALEGYLNKLIEKGYKAAICEQVEEASASKGIVKREVVRVVTPGTNLNVLALDETKNNYLMCITYVGSKFGVSVVDVTTGEFLVTEFDSDKKLIDEINKMEPAEIIFNEAFSVSGTDIDEVKHRLNIAVFQAESWYFDDVNSTNLLCKHFKAATINALGLDTYDAAIISAGGLLQYLYDTQKTDLSHISSLTPYSAGKYMLLDNSTRRNLELCETLREKQKRGSLLWVLDKTKTAMGARLLRKYIEQPLIDKDSITQRLMAVSEFKDEMINREEIREYLSPIYDLERIIGRVTYQSANPRDLVAFKNSLEMLPHIKNIMKDMKSDLLMDLSEELDTLEDIYTLIKSALNEEPPIAMKEGGLIKSGYNSDVDTLKKAKTEGTLWLAQLEERERESTGIKNLKVKYNKVFGFYIDVTNSYKNLVPEYYTRKQTLANSERYIIPELKELEDTILGAEDKLYALEFQLFDEIRRSISNKVNRVQKTAKVIANIDVFASLAVVASKNNYVCPHINEKGILDIKDGRHPVVEQMIEHDMFIANDTFLDEKKARVSIITGPNMAGKSTYMRQTALISLMAQIGSFVPASAANVSIMDRIFTRVGASDDLASGQSTFMVEMTEVANILRNATNKSLLILDEIGRGTSTFDGLSIAWSVVEHISDTKLLGAKTLFATHYHELTELEGKIDGVNNYCVAVKENGDDIVFLRKIIKGGADQSYGIEVAKIAGVPETVIQRAKEIVNELGEVDIIEKLKDLESDKAPKIKKLDEVDLAQMTLFDTVKDDDVLAELIDIDIAALTPLEALNLLNSLQSKLKNRW